MRATLNTGYACNNRCLFCDQGDLRARVEHPSTEALMEKLRQARAAADEIALSGGEATLRPDLPLLVAEAARLDFRVIELVTNGRVLATPEAAKRIVDAGAGRLVVSVALHGDSAAAHDYHTTVKGSFAQGVRAVVNLRKLGVPVWITTVVTRSNFRTAPALAESTAALGVARHKWSFPSPTGTLAQHFITLVPRFAMAAPYVAAAVELQRRAGVDARIKGAPPCAFPASARPFVEPAGPTPAPPLASERIALPARVHGAPCESCSLRASCPGPYEAYAREYGWAEFQPLPGHGTILHRAQEGA